MKKPSFPIGQQPTGGTNKVALADKAGPTQARDMSDPGGLQKFPSLPIVGSEHCQPFHNLWGVY